MNRDEVMTALTPISKPDSMLGLKLKERIEDTYDRCMRTTSDEATKQDCLDIISALRGDPLEVPEEMTRLAAHHMHQYCVRENVNLHSHLFEAAGLIVAFADLIEPMAQDHKAYKSNKEQET